MRVRGQFGGVLITLNPDFLLLMTEALGRLCNAGTTSDPEACAFAESWAAERFVMEPLTLARRARRLVHAWLALIGARLTQDMKQSHRP